MTVEPPTEQPNEQSKYRSWVFTANNYSEELLNLLLVLPCRYIIYGKEIAPTTGTPHLQGFVSFNSGRTLSATRTSMPGCHLLVARGTPSQNRSYCSKDGDFIERGDQPMDPSARGQLEINRYADAWTSAKEDRILEIPEDIRIRHYATLKRITRDYQPPLPRLAARCGIWIHGLSGSGKTTAVFDSYPEIYSKSLSKWWDGYQGQPTVLLDDVDPDCCVFLRRHLKIWTDRFPFMAEEKGGGRFIRPERIIITSQYTIEQCFSDPETIDAWNGRCNVIHKVLGQNIILV